MFKNQKNGCTCADSAIISAVWALVASSREVQQPSAVMPAQELISQDSPLLTIPEGAAMLKRTSGAVRHLIFQAESTSSSKASHDLESFKACIVRPLGQRRVFLHKRKLAALVDAWSGEEKQA